MGILEDAKTAEDKTVIYAEDLTYLDGWTALTTIFI
jgi:hypothetical protein